MYQLIRSDTYSEIKQLEFFFCNFVAKGRTIDATQEMLALGMCNLFGSFFQSMPVTGSITRTAVNNASGVRTTLSGIAKGALIILALEFLTNAFRFIPKATLAAVIICAMHAMVDVQEIKDIWRSKRICQKKFTIKAFLNIFF